MKEWIIKENDAGQRLDKFLQKAAPALPKSMMYKALRTKHIKLNGKRAEISARLAPGDRVTLYLKDEFFAKDSRDAFLQAPAAVRVVYEDGNILLADKPSGLVVHEDERQGADTLIHRVQHYLYHKGEYDPAAEASFAPALCNRIDRNTEGIVIVAKNAEALRLLNQCIRDRELHKFYLCLLKGVPRPKEATIKAIMRKDEREKKVAVIDKPDPGGKTMVTRYRVLKAKGKVSLCEVELLTGRTHQIRAHMA